MSEEFTLSLLVNGREITAFPTSVEFLHRNFHVLAASVRQLRAGPWPKAAITAEFPDGLVKVIWAKDHPPRHHGPSR